MISHFIVIFLTLTAINYIFSSVASIVSLSGSVIVIFGISWKLLKCIQQYRSSKSYITSFKKAILITGCDRGFGHCLAQKLNSQGFVVYATVLDIESDGANALKIDTTFPNQLKIIKMDVTKDDDVLNAYRFVREHSSNDGIQLWGVVNVAGIFTMAHVDWGTMESYRKIFEVNTIGTVRVTRTFLPLIRESRGRVINISSIAGKIHSALKSHYCMSKSAVISFSDALRREMNKWGVKVSTILPGQYRTFILSQQNIEHIMQNEWINTDKSVREVYGGQQYFESVKELIKELYRTTGSDNIELVVDAIIDGLRSESPQAVYNVWGTWRTGVVMFLNQYLPVEVMDRCINRLVSFVANK